MKTTRTVVALGGGMLVDDENRALVESAGTVVCLTCNPEAILKRMGDELNARPLLVGSGPLERSKALLAKRAALYASFPLTLDTTELAPEDVARKVQRLSGIFHLAAMGSGYDVVISRRLLPQSARRIGDSQTRRAVCDCQ